MAHRARTFLPVRSFDGMTRLAGSLATGERVRLARRLASRTADAARDAGTIVTVVSNDDAVRSWAAASGYAWIGEPVPGSLDAAAGAAVSVAAGDPWLVVHADLPAITPGDVAAAAAVAPSATVLAPSHDGGTSLVGGTAGAFPFRYGPGSFQRHFAAVAGRATVLVRPGLALDLDSPADLRVLSTLGFLDDTAPPAPGRLVGRLPPSRGAI